MWNLFPTLNDIICEEILTAIYSAAVIYARLESSIRVYQFVIMQWLIEARYQ